ncbi:MAG: hypothetical protein FJX35_11550 [Alphaproteobacteria bacterium]|nr:hypothetical protein [Alphaproteobacteria bacterium]
MTISSEIVIAWQIAHTVLLVAVLAYLLRVSGKLKELRDARGEAQVWLNEFARLINASTSAVRDMRVSIATAQEELPKVLAGVEAIKKNRAPPRRGDVCELPNDQHSDGKVTLSADRGAVARQGSFGEGLAVYDTVQRTRDQADGSPLARLK